MKKTVNNVGRKCSICTHKEVKKINSLITEGKSFRGISLKFGMSDMSVHRHTRNCLNLEISALIQQKKIDNALNVYDELREQFQFAKDLRLAAREYLSDEHGHLTLIPRPSDINVVYEDLMDVVKDKPKKKTDTLQTLLERAQDGGIEPKRTIIKHVDIRSFALNAISTADATLDKFARMEGMYQQDKQNNDELTELKKIIELSAQKSGTSYQEELKYFVENFATMYKPDLVDKLVSELEN